MLLSRTDRLALWRREEWRSDLSNWTRFRVVWAQSQRTFFVYMGVRPQPLGEGRTIRAALANARANHPELCGGAS